MTEPVFEMDLPEISALAEPEFNNALMCKAWLEHVPLANVGEAQHQLLAQTQEFNRFPCKAAIRVQVLETLREAVAFVQIEQAKRFTNRALPMAETEAAIFDSTTALWEQMRIGYLHCLAASAAGESGMRAQAALLAQRVLAYNGLKMFHHYRAYREIPAADWRSLHRTYRCAEQLAVEQEEVKDYLNRDVHEATPRIQYMRALLMGMANPNELARRQLSFVAYLLERWAEKVEISAQPVAENGMLPLLLDIAGDKPPKWLTGTGDTEIVDARFLDPSRLAKSLKNRIGLLRKGESPAKLALGEDCVQPSCEQLLVFLYRQWCQPRQPRGGERKRAPEPALVCNDMAAIHYYVLGKVFRQPEAQKELTQKERDQIATFGRISTKDEDDYSVVHGFLLEHWQIEDESVTGLRMVRLAVSPGKRFLHGQLVAVRPGNAKNFMLAQVRWLMQSNDGSLSAGLHLMAGLPAAISVRPYGLNATSEKYVAALTLTEIAALKSPPTLILPAGWYKPKRVIEVFVRQALRVKLNELIDRGPDFERISYAVMPD
ncbi:MAG: hypothetical protein EXR29_01795 [Betaproteobacteria bacterium]|nr:hypothetical protein [Betaproteobacteria bacterium]